MSKSLCLVCEKAVVVSYPPQSLLKCDFCFRFVHQACPDQKEQVASFNAWRCSPCLQMQSVIERLSQLEALESNYQNLEEQIAEICDRLNVVEAKLSIPSEDPYISKRSDNQDVKIFDSNLSSSFAPPKYLRSPQDLAEILEIYDNPANWPLIRCFEIADQREFEEGLKTCELKKDFMGKTLNIVENVVALPINWQIVLTNHSLCEVESLLLNGKWSSSGKELFEVLPILKAKPSATNYLEISQIPMLFVNTLKQSLKQSCVDLSNGGEIEDNEHPDLEDFVQRFGTFDNAAFVPSEEADDQWKILVNVHQETSTNHRKNCDAINYFLYKNLCHIITICLGFHGNRARNSWGFLTEGNLCLCCSVVGTHLMDKCLSKCAHGLDDHKPHKLLKHFTAAQCAKYGNFGHAHQIKFIDMWNFLEDFSLLWISIILSKDDESQIVEADITFSLQNVQIVAQLNVTTPNVNFLTLPIRSFDQIMNCELSQISFSTFVELIDKKQAEFILTCENFEDPWSQPVEAFVANESFESFHLPDLAKLSVVWKLFEETFEDLCPTTYIKDSRCMIDFVNLDPTEEAYYAWKILNENQNCEWILTELAWDVPKQNRSELNVNEIGKELSQMRHTFPTSEMLRDKMPIIVPIGPLVPTETLNIVLSQALRSIEVDWKQGIASKLISRREIGLKYLHCVSKFTQLIYVRCAHAQLFYGPDNLQLFGVDLLFIDYLTRELEVKSSFIWKRNGGNLSRLEQDSRPAIEIIEMIMLKRLLLHRVLNSEATKGGNSLSPANQKSNFLFNFRFHNYGSKHLGTDSSHGQTGVMKKADNQDIHGKFMHFDVRWILRWQEISRPLKTFHHFNGSLGHRQ